MKKLIMIAVIMQLIPGIANCMQPRYDDTEQKYTWNNGQVTCTFRDTNNPRNFCNLVTAVRRIAVTDGRPGSTENVVDLIGARVWIPRSVTAAARKPGRDALKYINHAQTREIVFELGSILTKLKRFSMQDTCMETLLLPDAVKGLGSECFSGNRRLWHFPLGSGSRLVKLGNGAFGGCSTLRYAKIPGSVEILEIGCFRGCRSLETVTFDPDCRATELGNCFFERCSALRGVKLPRKIEKIGARCFGDCESMEYCDFGEGSATRYIAMRTYEGCRSLTSIRIPAPVKNVGMNNFDGCSQLIFVQFEAGSRLERIDSGTFAPGTEFEGLPDGRWDDVGYGLRWTRTDAEV
ncbi:MAG: leucine-rich repeat domain-containing protein [Holosporaceae bacterium]|jgi:hypothetical protein|nr:leucine-rich repeat domain-containing protein [Holosporaceae bacterium]